MIFSLEYLIFLIFIGILAGISSGLLGVGGGFLMVPLQYFLLSSVGVDPDLALRISIGTSLAIIIPTALSGAYVHKKELKSIVKPGILLGIFGIVGGVLGAISSSYLSGYILNTVFGVFLIFTAIFFLFSDEYFKSSEKFKRFNKLKKFKKSKKLNKLKNLKKSKKLNKLKTSNKWGSFFRIFNKPIFKTLINPIFGICIGFLSGLLGIGGGIFLVPGLVFILACSMREAIGISTIFISLAAIGGVIPYILTGLSVNTIPFSIGYINLVNLSIIAIFSIIFANIGARLVYKVPERRLKQIFTLIIIYMGIKILGLDPISYFLGM